ncbi:hypothetical protein ABEZ21_17255, partial [Brevibacillus porteri]|uniref:pectate lyase-like adhesive domain-containing protein n=2 Tax=Brevibacillus porteri TaxID=2126350 RepID=UPI003D2459B4
MNKKVALSLLSATIVSSMAASAFALPKSGVYLGGEVDRFYAFEDLFKLTEAGNTKFGQDLEKTKFENLIYVDPTGKGASLSEIMNSDDYDKIKRDLKKSDFEGVYTQSKIDGSNGATYDPRPDAIDGPVGDLKVESVSAINLTSVTIKLNKAVDAVTAANFSIPGLTVASATLSEDKKTVTLAVTGAKVSTSYKVTISGVKVNAEVQPDFAAEYKTPAQGDLYKPSLEAKATVLKSDGASSTLVTFKLLDAEGKLMENAQDVEVAFSSTFGNFAEKRVTVQKGVATAMFTSESLTSDRTAEITALVVEAQDKNLIGLKQNTNILLTPNPDSVDPTTGALMSEAEAFQADRVVVYFNKAVKVEDFTYATGVNKGKIDPKKATIAVNTAVKNDLSEGTVATVVGLAPVAGNDKALQVILDTATPLVDNANVRVQFTDLRGSIAVPSTKGFKLTDARKPAMLSVSREGLKTIKIAFSEPVNLTSENVANWIIDGKPLGSDAFGVAAKRATAKVGTFNPVTGEDTRHVVTISLGNDNAGNQIYFQSGTHSVQGANIGDWAQNTDKVANLMNTQTLDFAVPVDTGAPGATVEVHSPEQYVVTFDKDINQAAAFLETNLKLQKYNTDTSVWEDVTNPVIDVTDISEDGQHKFLVEVQTDWTVVYDTATTKKNYYNDSYRLHLDKDKVTAASNGIKNAEINMALGGAMTSPDVTSPTISKIDKTPETAEGTSYDVTMSEPVKINSGANTEGLTPSQAQGNNTGVPVPTAEFIKKDKSMTVPGVVATTFVDNEEKVIRVTPQEELAGGEWTLVVRSISDDVGNTAASATKDFTVVKNVEDTDFRVTFAKADFDGNFADDLLTDLVDDKNDYVFVKFSKAAAITGDFKNVLKTSNYTLNGAALPQGTQIFGDITGYDDFDKVIDSITIKLPQGSITDPRTTVINISSELQAADGKALANPGEKKLPYNYGEAATGVSTLDELKAAIANDSIREIKLSANITAASTLNVNRLVNIDLNGQSITGNVAVNSNEGGKMEVKGGTITGNLTVNTPNADFTVGAGATVTGTTTIKDVASSTFINNGTLGNVTIEDGNGTQFKNNGTVGTVTVATTGNVTLDGTIENVTATKAAKLTIKGAVTNLTAKASGVVLVEGNATNKIVDGGSFKDKDGKDITEGVQNPTGDAAAAKVVDDKIAALPAVADLKETDEAAVQAARADYDKLTAAQKALVKNLSTLEAAEAKIAELKGNAADVAAAKVVDDKIAALPAVA